MGMKFHNYSLVKGYDKHGRQCWKTYCLACSDVGAGYIYPCTFESQRNSEIPPRILYEQSATASGLNIGDRVQTTYEWAVVYSIPSRSQVTGEVTRIEDVGPLRADRNVYVKLDKNSPLSNPGLWFNPIYLEKIDG